MFVYKLNLKLSASTQNNTLKLDRHKVIYILYTHINNSFVEKKNSFNII